MYSTILFFVFSKKRNQIVPENLDKIEMKFLIQELNKSAISDMR